MWGFLVVSREVFSCIFFCFPFLKVVFGHHCVGLGVGERTRFVLWICSGCHGRDLWQDKDYFSRCSFNWNVPGSCSVIPRVLGHVLLFPDCQIDF